MTYIEWLNAGPYGYETYTFMFDILLVTALTWSGGYLLAQAFKDM